VTKKTDTTWIQAGAPAALYRGHGRDDGSRVTLVTIERLTAIQIVLDNGVKFRRDTLTMVGHRYSGLELLPVDDLRVRRDQAFRRVIDIESAARRHLRSGTDPAEALAELLRMAVDAAAETDPVGGVYVEAKRWVVSVFPHDHQRTRYFRVLIERRLGNRFVVTDGADGSGEKYLDGAGEWHFPAGRDDVREVFWHDWDTAVRLARAEAIRLGEEAVEQERLYREKYGPAAEPA
jgi:hypothetical protein